MLRFGWFDQCKLSLVARYRCVAKRLAVAALIVLGLMFASTAAMATCSVTYTFSNGTTADATQVNQNFADIVACAGTNFWTVSGSNLVPTSTSYNVGIGTASPTEKLYVAGDLLPVMPPFMGRVCSGYAPQWGGLQSPLV